MTYLDANATDMPRPEARTAAIAAMDLVGNPSSVHADGRAARRLLQDSRARIAACLNADPSLLVFTSGGTEANALAIHALGAGRRLIVGATEHDAIRANAPGASILPVDENGVARLDALVALLTSGPPALLCLMLANNETGVIHPIAEAAALCRQHGALLHVDAVQALGRIPVDLAALGADSIAVSGHKLGGPKGAGALLFATEPPIRPLIAGGGQESGWRGGTPALPAIAGFAAAAAAATSAARDTSSLAALRDAAEAAAVAAGALVCGGGAPRLPNTTCLILPHRAADTQLIALDMAGIRASAGAACSSGKVKRSHVLEAMGLGAQAGDAIRISLPWCASSQDIDHFASAYTAMAARLLPRAA